MTTTHLYPLKFRTIFKDKLWGGQKIRTVLGKDFGDLPNCGETWELSGVEGNISIVSNGDLVGQDLKSLIVKYKGELLGESIYESYGEEFPLLIKFIDAADDLSIQVHPDDELAAKRHDSKGKTEMWYVIEADEGASLISGFNQDLTRDGYLEYFESGRLTEILNREQVQDGDVFFLPAGRVHTIGKGLMIAEIQQTSDITYRIYDFDRVDTQGNKRELHVEEALDAIDFKKYDTYKSAYSNLPNERVVLESNQYFTTNKLVLDRPFEVSLPNLDCFKIYICLEGSADLVTASAREHMAMGEAVLVPATWKDYRIEPADHLVVLESYIDG
ncbi:MAG: type I phosphomannose isomerase catalytic subunit [Bacteroidota bacterium]